MRIHFLSAVLSLCVGTSCLTSSAKAEPGMSLIQWTKSKVTKTPMKKLVSDILKRLPSEDSDFVREKLRLCQCENLEVGVVFRGEVMELQVGKSKYRINSALSESHVLEIDGRAVILDSKMSFRKIYAIVEHSFKSRLSSRSSLEAIAALLIPDAHAVAPLVGGVIWAGVTVAGVTWAFYEQEKIKVDQELLSQAGTCNHLERRIYYEWENLKGVNDYSHYDSNGKMTEYANGQFQRHYNYPSKLGKPIDRERFESSWKEMHKFSSSHSTRFYGSSEKKKELHDCLERI